MNYFKFNKTEYLINKCFKIQLIFLNYDSYFELKSLK